MKYNWWLRLINFMFLVEYYGIYGIMIHTFHKYMTINEAQTISALARNANGCKFASVLYRSVDTRELARYSLLIGVSYENAVDRDLEFLYKLKKYKPYGDANTPAALVHIQAVDELINGLERSKSKFNQTSNAADIYTNICNGIKKHKETGVFYLWGFIQQKTVINPSTAPSKSVQSKPLTIEKNRIRRKLHTDSYRQFKIDNIGTVKINNQTLVLE